MRTQAKPVSLSHEDLDPCNPVSLFANSQKAVPPPFYSAIQIPDTLWYQCLSLEPPSTFQEHLQISRESSAIFDAIHYSASYYSRPESLSISPGPAHSQSSH